MPRHEVILQVLVASPSDVGDERAALEDVIQELNATWSRNLGIRLDLVRWETHGYPGFGQDAQDVLNRELPDDYDVFIGIMWTRFGTATGRAGSGTKEEFDRAYRRYLDNPDSLRLMFYFKDAPISPSKMDPMQLAAINRFKGELEEKGGLHWSFSALDEFQALMRVHLSRVVQGWAQGQSRTQAESTAPETGRQLSEQAITVSEAVSNAADGELPEEPGFIESIEVSNDSFNRVNEIVNRLTEALQTLTRKINERTEEMNALQGSSHQVDLNSTKRVIAGAAEDMEEYVARTEVEIPLFSQGLQTGLTAFASAASLYYDFPQEDTAGLHNALQNIRALRSKSTEARNSITGMRGSVAQLPRPTSVLNRAKRKTLATLDELLRQFEAGERLTTEVEQTIENLLKQ